MEQRLLKVLVIEDDEDDYILVRDMLSDITSSCYEVDWVMTYEEGLAQIRHPAHDVYLLDYLLGGRDGLELLKEAGRIGCRVPIIFLTGQGDYQVDVGAMKAGAADYLMKGQITPPLLDRSIRYSIQRAQTEEELRRHREHLEDLVRSRTRELIETNEQLQSEVAERRRAEEALRKSRRLLERTFASLDEAVFVVDLPERTIITCNSAVERIFGYTREELIGKSAQILHVNRSMFEEYGRKVYPALDANGVFHTEFQMKRKDGTVFPTDNSVTELLGDSGKPTTVVNAIRDITEVKRLAEDLLRIKKLEAAGILAGGVAHDFNNLLAVIWGNISMVQEVLEPGHGAQKLLCDAEQAAIRARDLIRKFITFATGGTPSKRTVSIDELLSSSVPAALAGSGVECRYELSDSLWSIEIDRDQIGQVIYNVVRNAREAMPAGGVVRVSAQNVALRSSGEKEDMSWQEGRYVLISIEDDGLGIRQEHLEKIFDPYFSTKTRGSQKGMGLGLAIALSVVKKHGGFIRVESELGKGTVFHIYLPAEKEPSAPS